MDNLLPNFAIMKSPSNWLLIAFSLVLMGFIYHLINKED